MNDTQKAKEILEYCCQYISNMDNLEIEKFIKTKLGKDMIKEIDFMINTS